STPPSSTSSPTGPATGPGSAASSRTTPTIGTKPSKNSSRSSVPTSSRPATISQPNQPGTAPATSKAGSASSKATRWYSSLPQPTQPLLLTGSSTWWNEAASQVNDGSKLPSGPAERLGG